MATDMFLKIDDIRGDAVDAAHHGEIEVLHWEWGISQAGSAHSGSGSGTGKVAFQDLVLKKYSDRSSPILMKLCCNGKHFTCATLTVRKAGGKALEYFRIKLHDGIVSAVIMEGRVAGERLAETVRLNFAAYTQEYTPQSPSGAPMASIPSSWNVSTNTPT